MNKQEIDFLISKRYEYNKKILSELSNYIEKNQDMRFIQALWALNIVDREDRFYEESVYTYERIKYE